MIESPRHELDQAIDRVATKLVAAPGADDLLQQVIARLPERETTPWFLTMPVQLAAAAAIVVVAFVYARPPREHGSLPSLATKPVEEGVGLVAPAPARVARSAPLAIRRLPTPTSAKATAGRPDSRLPGVMREDHERSLAPVGAIEALELSEIAAPALALDAPETLQPLVLTDLALDPEGDR